MWVGTRLDPFEWNGKNGPIPIPFPIFSWEWDWVGRAQNGEKMGGNFHQQITANGPISYGNGSWMGRQRLIIKMGEMGMVMGRDLYI